MSNDVQTIDIDCPPGSPRPGDLIGAVIDGLGIAERAVTPLEDVTPLFGNAEYAFHVPHDEWVSSIQPTVKERIVALYDAGLIRFGSW